MEKLWQVPPPANIPLTLKVSEAMWGAEKQMNTYIAFCLNLTKQKEEKLRVIYSETVRLWKRISNAENM